MDAWRKALKQTLLGHRVARRFVAVSVNAQAATDLGPVLTDIVGLHEQQIQPWIQRFPQILKKAEQASADLPEGWVRQNEFVPYLNQYDDKLAPKMAELEEKLFRVELEADFLVDEINMVRAGVLEPARKARLAHAISDIDFFGTDIGYKVSTLKEWATAFEAWSKASVVAAKTAAKRAKQKTQRRAK